MKISKNDVVTLVMSNGAEIIGKYVDAGTDTYTINKPRMVQMGEQGLGLVNGVCMTGEEVEGDMDFNRGSVAYVIKTSEDIAKGYSRQVSSIVMPDQGIIK